MDGASATLRDNISCWFRSTVALQAVSSNLDVIYSVLSNASNPQAISDGLSLAWEDLAQQLQQQRTSVDTGSSPGINQPGDSSSGGSTDTPRKLLDSYTTKFGPLVQKALKALDEALSPDPGYQQAAAGAAGASETLGRVHSAISLFAAEDGAASQHQFERTIQDLYNLLSSELQEDQEQGNMLLGVLLDQQVISTNQTIRAIGLLAPKFMPGPQARTKEQQVKFATDRNYTQQADGMYIFGNDQVKDLSYGTTTVKLALVKEASGTTSNQYHIELTRTTVAASDADRPAVEGWLKGLRQAIADSKQKELVIFIHGYKNSFEDCVKSAAQLVVDTDDAADDDSDTREPRAALVFDWASCDALQQYRMDLIRARRASSKLARLLVDVGNVLEAGRKVHIVCHSMGNYVLHLALLHRFPVCATMMCTAWCRRQHSTSTVAKASVNEAAVWHTA